MSIASVVPNSPAARAGLLPQDKILSVDGRRIFAWTYFASLVKSSAVKQLA